MDTWRLLINCRTGAGAFKFLEVYGVSTSDFHLLTGSRKMSVGQARGFSSVALLGGAVIRFG